MARLLVTGGAGFIGANFVHYWAEQYPSDRIVVLDALTYAGNLASLEPVVGNEQFRFVKGDIVRSRGGRGAVARGADRHHRALRGRVARRPLHRRPGRVHRHQRGRHAQPVAGCPRSLARTATMRRPATVSTTSRPTKCMARWDATIRALARPRPTRRTRRTRPARPPRTTWCVPTTTPTACRSRPATAPTTTGRTSSRKS